MKIQKYQRRGMVTLLNVVVIGGFLLGIMAVAYRSSIRALEGQKKVQLLIDYEARQQSLLRSIVTLTPQYAANTMMDDSNGDASASFAGMFTTAGSMAKLGQVLTAAEVTAMGFGAHRNGNTGNVTTGYNVTDFIGGGLANVPSGLGSTQQTGYPNVMADRSVTATANSTVAPLITHDGVYDGLSTARTPGDFALLTYPDIHFGYKNPGDPFITRQNWWQLYVHPRAADIAAVGLGATTMNDSRFEYVLSVFEIPSQLAVSSSAFLDIGNIGGTGFDDTKITVAGNLYAKKANVTSGAFDGIATTEGATLSGGATVGGQDGAGDRATYEAANTNFYPISKASDYARSMFVPINPGFEFFDRFANASTGNNRLSADSWYDYSRGANQCAIQIDVIETEGAGDQTPTALRFTNGAYSTLICKASSAFRSGGSFVNWPENDAVDPDFPFVVSASAGGDPSLIVYLDRFEAWLQTADGGNVSVASLPNCHSIVVNADYNQTDVATPALGNSPITVQIMGCDDLSSFDEGFSIVTNYNLEILDDFNQEPVTAGGTDYPPTSIFAPQVTYGFGATAGSALSRIKVTGSLASMNTGNNAVELFQLQNAAGTDAAVAETYAELTAINTLDELPPVNMMNWLIVIQKQGM